MEIVVSKTALCLVRDAVVNQNISLVGDCFPRNVAGLLCAVEMLRCIA